MPVNLEAFPYSKGPPLPLRLKTCGSPLSFLKMNVVKWAGTFIFPSPVAYLTTSPILKSLSDFDARLSLINSSILNTDQFSLPLAPADGELRLAAVEEQSSFIGSNGLPLPL